MDAKMQIRLPKEMYEKFKEVADNNAQVPSLLVRKWIENYIKEETMEMAVRAYETDFGRTVYFDSVKELSDHIQDESIREVVERKANEETISGVKEFYVEESDQGVILSVVKVHNSEIQEVIFELNKIKDQGFGIVIFEGKEYALTQQPYIDGPAGGTPFYRASAIDAEGNDFEVTWEVVDNWEEIEDEQQMVEDWDSPADVTEI